MRSSSLMSFVLLLGVCLPGQILAEEREGTNYYHDPVWYAGGRIGYVELEKVDDDGSFNFGVFGGVFPVSRVGVELSIDFQESEFAIVDTENFLITTAQIDRETTSLQAALNLSPFPEQQVRPFLVGGVGYYFSDYSGAGFSGGTVSDSGYFAGFGAEMFGESWDGDSALVVEARWLFTSKEEIGDESIRPDGYTVSIGFRKKFGR